MVGRMNIALHGTLVLAGLLTLPAAAPQETAAETPNVSGGALLEEQACFDVIGYDLDLEVMPETRTISGSLAMEATMTEASREIALHLDPLLEVRRVTIGKLGEGAGPEPVEVPFRHDRGIVFMDLSPIPLEKDRRFVVRVDYGGAPRVAVNAPWNGGFTWAESKGKPWIATTCQGEGADLWWPCKDHPSDKPEWMDLSFTVPEGLVVATNGKHLFTVPEGEGRVSSHWHVSTPISNYAVSFNAGPFVELERTMKSVAGDEIPVRFWVLPESEEKATAFLNEIVDHVAFMEEVCGPYPFRADKYGVVETPHLGMEHQTIIAYGNGFRGDPNFDYDWLHHHELAHEWWGNLVTARDWADFWIHEGIGTYMQPLYLERRFGREAYEEKMKIDLLKVRNRGPIGPPAPRTTKSIYFDSGAADAPGGDIYYKGSWVCHSLRWVLGDEVFFQVLRRWAYPDPELESTTDGSAVRLTDTDELISIAEEVAERELGWFFDVYVRSAGAPALTHGVEDGMLTLAWESPVKGSSFPMPVEIIVDGEARRVEMPGGRATVEVGDAKVEVDPKMRALRKPR